MDLMSRAGEVVKSISKSSLMADIRALTAPRMRGRMPGDVGYERASDHVAAKFAAAGLKPLNGSDDYRQTFTMETNRVIEADVSVMPTERTPRTLKIGVDYVCRGLTPAGAVAGPLVFVGYGRQDAVIDELSGVDLNGKIVLSFKYPPPWAKSEPVELPRARARRFKAKGAVGLALLANPNREQPDRLSASLMEDDEPLPGFPIIVLSEETSRELMDDEDETLASRQWRLDTYREPISAPVAAAMGIRIVTDWNPNGLHWNLAGVLPGHDSRLAREAIVVGGHLDHVGIQGESAIFPGAQDNATGAAAVTAIAQALALGPPLPLSVIFIAFGAEEAGLLGSKHFVNSNVWPADRMRAMLNFDCMGAGIGLNARGVRDFPGLIELLESINRRHGDLDSVDGGFAAGGADAQPFHQRGVPNIYFCSKLPFQHLHMTSDTVETLNPPLFRSITRLGAMQAFILANDHPVKR